MSYTIYYQTNKQKRPRFHTLQKEQRLLTISPEMTARHAQEVQTVTGSNYIGAVSMTK